MCWYIYRKSVLLLLLLLLWLLAALLQVRGHYGRRRLLICGRRGRRCGRCRTRECSAGRLWRLTRRFRTCRPTFSFIILLVQLACFMIIYDNICEIFCYFILIILIYEPNYELKFESIMRVFLLLVINRWSWQGVVRRLLLPWRLISAATIRRGRRRIRSGRARVRKSISSYITDDSQRLFRRVVDTKCLFAAHRLFHALFHERVLYRVLTQNQIIKP